jgi:uncharacterized lipoprotein YajG
VGEKEAVMKRITSILVVLALTALAAGCGGTTTVTKTVTVRAPERSNDVVQFGFVKSLERKGSG